MERERKKRGFLGRLLIPEPGFWRNFIITSAILAGVNSIDNAFIYNRNLQSPKQVQEVVREYEGEIGQRGHKEGKRDFAVLVASSGFLQSKRVGNTADIQRAYDTLKRRGYREEDIIVLSNSIPSGRSLNGTINARPTRLNISEVLDYVSKNAGDKGSIFFYFDGHGTAKRGNSKIALTDSVLKQGELYGYLGKTKADKIVVINACYSGGFARGARDLEGNFAVMTLTSDHNFGIWTKFGGDFWEGVESGKKVTSAYEDAVRKNDGKLYRRVFTGLTLGKAKNAYIIVDRGDVDIPRPRRHYLEEQVHREGEKAVSHGGLEKKAAEFVLFILIAVLSAIFLKLAVTGGVIGVPSSQDGQLFLILIFTGVLLFLLLIIVRLRE